MQSSSTDRCGYVFSGDDRIRHQSCCYREALANTHHCAFHAKPGETDNKAENFSEALAPEDIRDNNTPFNEILDGSILTGERLYPLTCENLALRKADLTNAHAVACELSGANLRHADLTEADLRSADLTDANLTKADLTGANLSKADLTGANLAMADLNGANLADADLTDAGLSNSNLTNADLRGADLTNIIAHEVDLTDAYLSQTDLTNTELTSANLTGALLVATNLTNADLTYADLSNTLLADAELPYADLSNADLTEADLVGADLTRAQVNNCKLVEASLKNANLFGAEITGSNLTNANLAGSNVIDANFSATTLRGTELPPADSFRNANLSEANLEGQDLREKNLSGTKLKKANLTDADLSMANLSDANLERALLNRADLFDTRFSGAQLNGAVFGNVQVNEGTFEKLKPSGGSENQKSFYTCIKRFLMGPSGNNSYRCVYDPVSQFSFSQDNTSIESSDRREAKAGSVYRELERLAADNALPSWQQKFFMLRQDMQTRQKSGSAYAFAVLQRTLFGFGESFRRVVGWSGSIILIFSLLYLVGGLIRPVQSGGELGSPVVWTRLPTDLSVIWESLYYSTLTFTALGFGDFRPVGALGQALTIAETAVGALLFALIVFVLGRRAAR